MEHLVHELAFVLDASDADRDLAMAVAPPYFLVLRILGKLSLVSTLMGEGKESRVDMHYRKDMEVEVIGLPNKPV